MSISDNYIPIRQLGNGSTTQFSSNWAVLAAAYIRVYLESVITGVATLQTLNSDYTLVFDDSGFTVTFAVAPTSANYVIVGRSVSIDQTDPYSTSKGFQGSIIEDSFDKLTAIAQDSDDITTRSLKFPLGSSANGILPAPVDDTVLAWSGTGGTVKNGPTTASIIAGSTSAAASAATAMVEAVLATAAAASASASAAQAAAIASGVGRPVPATAATTANITLSGTQTIDGVAVNIGDRVLVKNQTSQPTNGIYVVASGAWARAVDADTWAELVSLVLAVLNGTVNAGQSFVCTVAAGGTLGVTNVTFATLPVIPTDNTVSTTKIIASAVTYAKIQNISANSLLGNPTGGAHAPVEISLGAGLSFSAGALVATAVGSPVLHAQGFDSSTNFTAPAATISTTVFKFTITGGGGGAVNATNGGGAGGGATGIALVSGLVASTNYVVTIGAGGGHGSAGGTSSIVINGTTYSAAGGSGSTGTAGGAGSTTTTNCSETYRGTGGFTYVSGAGGIGGGSFYGQGGSPAAGGEAYGAGGGAGNGTTGGGVGAQGYIRVEWVL